MLTVSAQIRRIRVYLRSIVSLKNAKGELRCCYNRVFVAIISPTGNREADLAVEFSDIACPGCGCLCDDLVVSVQDNRIVATENACAAGQQWWQEHSASHLPPTMVHGGESSLAEAVAATVDLLQRSRAPHVCIAGGCGVETQRAAIELAEAIGGTCDTLGSPLHEAATLAFQTVGQSAATLGELRNRADLFLFWRSDPGTSHPRFMERFVDTAGSFVAGGRADRKLIVIDDKQTPTAELADEFIELPWEDDLATIAQLRAYLRDSSQADAAEPRIRQLLQVMSSCRYGVVCLGEGFESQPDTRQVVESLFELVRELNEQTRFVAQVMGGPAMSEVLTWQTGFPMSVSFADGFPRYGPNEYSLEPLLERGESDCLLVVGDSGKLNLSERATESLISVPVIAVGNICQDNVKPEVSFASAMDGIHCEAVAFRMDEVPVPLRAVLESTLPTKATILRNIGEALR